MSTERDNGRARGRYHIETWGCSMNVLDSDKLAGLLERDGYRRASGRSDADVILLNTCSIREKAAEKVFSELGRLQQYKRRNPGLVLGVCGCVAQQEKDAIFRRAPFVDLVIGPRATGSLPGLLTRLRDGDRTARQTVDTEYRNDSIDFPWEDIRREGIHTGKAFVTIIEGCNHKCTFCIVPTTRGREICRDMDDILGEVRSLATRGVCEIEYLGQTVNAYRDGEGRRLGDLLVATAEIEDVDRIRFTTSHPAQMTDALMDAMAAAQPKVCPYLHLPAQSGSSRVLRAMKRGYDRDGYLRKIDGLRRRIPEILMGTDMIVGFPTEDEDDFRETLTLLDEVEYDTVYSFVYSPRPGTRALDLTDDVPLAEKQDRLGRLLEHQRAIHERRNRVWVGRDVAVLVEGPSKKDAGEWTGRTPENRIVNFGGVSAPGRMERLRITGSSAHSLRGELAGQIS
jgi:tRNA-2-methylthio-N6-dimethylallyladenosine synthase